MYNRSDLTFIYPIARGCAPFFVTIISLIFFVDHIPLLGILGILIISLGLILISLENYKKKIDFKLIGISLFIALIISIYTFFDGAGVRSVNKRDRKSTRLNSSHVVNSYAVFCLKQKI